jgi:hypothetical protein
MIVIKDCRYRPKLARPLIRWLLRRECKAHLWLYGTGLFPSSWAGSTKTLYVALRTAHTYFRARHPPALIQTNIRRQKSVQILPERRLFHMDLRSGDNVLVMPCGRVYLVDLASMVKL